MLDRLYEQRSCIAIYVTQNDCSIPILTNADCKLIENLLKVLAPLEMATVELSGDKYCSLSLVIPILTQIFVDLKELKLDDIHIKVVRDKLIASIKKRFHSVEENKYYRSSTLLDPRIKDTCFTSETNRRDATKQLLAEIIEKANLIKKSLSQLEPNINTVAEEPAKKKRRTVFDFVKDQQFEKPVNDLSIECSVELDNYLNEPVAQSNDSDHDHVDIFIWWKDNQNRYKNLYRLVSRYLCIPATSCPSERIFSKAGEVISADRSRLSPQHANELIFCSENDFM